MARKQWHELKHNAAKIKNEVSDFIERETQYIEVPFRIYGGKDTVVYPWILVALIIGAFLGALFLL